MIFSSGFFYFYDMNFPKSLSEKLKLREETHALRKLPIDTNGIDFSSNDYLGFAQNSDLYDRIHHFLVDQNIKFNGATGSRLISGNHHLYTITEDFIAQFHESEAALLFNSGYDANIGFFSAVPQRNDIVLYDELCHASIRDGIQMGTAKAYKFQHNDYEDLEEKLKKYYALKTDNFSIYVVTESVFSMDGDSPNFESILNLCQQYEAYLVVDEAHALGVFGEKGEGLLQFQKLHKNVFARIMTFGKGLGCHGAVILGSSELKSYLINFARSFIYTTGLSPHAVATILNAYKELNHSHQIQLLKENVNYFNQQKQLLGLKPLFIYSKSAIHSAIIPGNEKVKNVAFHILNKGFEVKPILSPTVPEGQERLRICIHSYNTQEQISQLLTVLTEALLN